MAIPIDQLAAEVNKRLELFAGATDEVVKDATVKVAKKTVQTLKSTSPKRTGEYARSWRRDKIKTGRHSYAEVIHAGNGEYRLTHLLENPRRVFYWGRYAGKTTAGTPHIEPAEEQAIAEFEAELRRGIEGISK